MATSDKPYTATFPRAKSSVTPLDVLKDPAAKDSKEARKPKEPLDLLPLESMPRDEKKDELGSESKWLDAFSDPLAQIYAFSQSLTLADLQGDGDAKLVVGDLGTGKFNMTLKVYKGVMLYKENALVDLPTAVLTFFMDQEEPRVPVIGVASGPSVYIYKNLRPYYKFNVPGMAVHEAEAEIWAQVKEDQLDVNALAEFLESLKGQVTFAAMTPRSQRFLTLKSVEERKTFLKNYTREELKKPTTVTCMETLKKASIDADSIDCLVLGCENGALHFVDGEALTVNRSVMLPDAAVHLHCSGLFDVEYRVLAAARNGVIYSIKRDTVEPKVVVELSSQPVRLLKVAKNIVVGCQDATLRAYSLKGRKQWQLSLPAPITAMANMEYQPRNYSACLVALENRELHVYQDHFLVDLLRFEDVVSGLRFGQFGREEGALVAVMRGGGLSVKVFKRTARLEERSQTAGAPVAQSQKLNIPKKTKVFVDQTIREREEGKKIHQIFQREQFSLRLAVAKDYVKMLDAKMNPVTAAVEQSTKQKSGPEDRKAAATRAMVDMVKLSASVQGFGPTFRLRILLDATSDVVNDLCVTFHFNTRLYRMEEPLLPVGMLLPGLTTTLTTNVTCLAPEKGLADDLKIFLVKEGHTEPLITALITMPLSEQPMF